MAEPITTQPTARVDPMVSASGVHAVEEDGFNATDGDGGARLPSLAQVKRKLTTREGWIGSYGTFTLFDLVSCFAAR